MPFQSQAQWKKFGELLKQGKVSQESFDEFARSSRPFAELPERVNPKPVRPVRRTASRRRR